MSSKGSVNSANKALKITLQSILDSVTFLTIQYHKEKFKKCSSRF